MLSKEYEKQKKKLEEQLTNLSQDTSNELMNKDLQGLIKQVLSFKKDKIDRNLLLKLINKIEINNRNQITIFYNFKQPS